VEKKQRGRKKGERIGEDRRKAETGDLWYFQLLAPV